MHNILGIVISFLYVAIVITLSTLMENKKILGPEGSRKFIHIGVSNWWFLVLFLFDNLWFAILPPFIFIIMNYYSYKNNLIKSMERGGNGNLGTVYFPISLLILTIFSYIIDDPIPGGIGIFILGYGDGLAAVIGKKFGIKKLIQGKSIVGFITIFIVSFIIVFILTSYFTNYTLLGTVIVSFVVGFTGAVIELITPRGLDNLTVPFVTAMIYYLFYLKI